MMRIWVDTVGTNSPLGKSDHAILSFTYTSYVDIFTDTSKFQLFRGNYKKMCALLRVWDWKEGAKHETVEELWNCFENK